MKVILRHRNTGRTQELILMCSQAEKGGRASYIVCSTQQEARRIFEVAEKLESPIAFPITYDEFLNRQYAARNIHNFFIDNADQLLQYFTVVTIQAVTMELEQSE